MSTKLQKNEYIWGYIFLFPAFLGVIIFLIIPVLVSLVYSFSQFDGIQSPRFIGLENYVNLFKEESFWLSLRNTVVFTIGVVPLSAIISLVLAFALTQKIKGSQIYKLLFFIPNVTSFIAISIAWMWLYNYDYGIINNILNIFGLNSISWLSSTRWAMISVINVSVWKSLGFFMLIFLAGLQGISPTIYEAATIDGAGKFRQFVSITLPLISNTLFFVLCISLIGSFQAFDQIYMLTRGGPAQSTQVVVYLIYMNAFQWFKQGYGSAMAYVLFVIILTATLIQFRVNKKGEVHG